MLLNKMFLPSFNFMTDYHKASQIAALVLHKSGIEGKFFGDLHSIIVNKPI